MSIETTSWDVQDYLRTPEDCALFIQAAIEEAGDDPAFIAKALDEVARATSFSDPRAVGQDADTPARTSAP
jgi:DNA-binding phage protein